MAQAIVTVGLGFGDEGKGSMVDALCQHMRADLVVRYSGGYQAAHHVVAPNGMSHCFSQWGAGTFCRVPTWLWADVIIDPLAMVPESTHLTQVDSLLHPWSLLIVHPDCPVATSVHRLVNRRKETARGEHRHGSCGLGIGECRDMSRRFPEATIRALDLPHRSLCRDKLMQQCELLDVDPNTLPDVAYQLDTYQAVAQRWSYGDIPRQPLAHVIFEGAQGVLLDEHVGFHPYTTWSTVTLQAAQEPLRQLQITDVHNLGITRTMATRHGAGPLPGWQRDMKLPTDHNQFNEWQGDFRVGYLNDQLLSYAAGHCGDKLDSVALTWVDSMPDRIVTGDVAISSIPNDGTRATCLLAAPWRIERVGLADMLICIENACRTEISCLSFGPAAHNKVIRL